MSEKDRKKGRYGSRKVDLKDILGKREGKKVDLSETVENTESRENEEKEKDFFELLKKREEEPQSSEGEAAAEEGEESLAGEEEVEPSPAESQPDELISSLKELVEREKEVASKFDRLFQLLEQAEEDPLAEAVKETSESIVERIDLVNENLNRMDRRLENLRERLDSLLGIEEKPHLANLEGSLRRLGMEIEMLPSNSRISLEELAKRAELSKEEGIEAVKQLVAKGWRIEMVKAEEKSLGGVISKKVNYIVKNY